MRRVHRYISEFPPRISSNASELRRRRAFVWREKDYQIMKSSAIARSFDRGTEFWLRLGFVLVSAALIAVVFALMGAKLAPAQAAPAPAATAAPASGAPFNPKDIAGDWQGTLHAGRDLRIMLKVTKDDKEAYKASFFSIDQTGQPFPVDSVALDGSSLKLAVNATSPTHEIPHRYTSSISIKLILVDIVVSQVYFM